MTTLIVARGESPGGGGSDPWTEGPNLVTNGDFETPMPDLPFGDAHWSAIYNNETAERVTVSPLGGTASLHVVTVGESNESEGVETYFTLGDVHSRDVVRLRFTIKGTTGTVSARAKFDNTGLGVLALVIPWVGIPTVTSEIIQKDFVVPSRVNNRFNTSEIAWRPLVQFCSFNEIADFTIDDVYFGILTPA